MVASSLRPFTVTRTSSSSNESANFLSPVDMRRTRKRISAAQLVHLEELYRQTSHPTRDQRDALAKRIQMETKSVTIWFQNKRQTDRKVALHNATNSHNFLSTEIARLDTRLNVRNSFTCPLPTYEQDTGTRKSFIERFPRRQTLTRPPPLKRVASLASTTSSISSPTSITGALKTSVSLDRIASRTEIRSTNRRSLPARSLVKMSNLMTPVHTNCVNTSAPAQLSGSPRSVLTSCSPSAVFPPRSASPPLWEAMLSSPFTPSSPPPPEYIACARARKARKLDWACAAARLSALDPASTSPFDSPPANTLQEFNGAVSRAQYSVALDRKCEEAMSVTEDEAELITPYGSQDTHMSWLKPLKKANREVSGDSQDLMDVCIMEDINAAHGVSIVPSIASHGWEDDEMHAALALCRLRG